MTNTMNTYLGFFNGKQTQIEAPTLYAAKQAAVAFFKPKKKVEHMVHVHLVQLAGESKPIVHVAVD